MLTITGVTGHVGGATARELLERGLPVRVVLRDPAKRGEWDRHGAEVAIADLTDRSALTKAFRDSDGVFVMLPIIPTLDDTGHRQLADRIVGAVKDSGAGHVVLLSSVAADLPDGTGPIRWLHYLESLLSQTASVVTAIRPCHYQEGKVEPILDTVLDEGIYPVFAESADRRMPMIATRDVGRVAADALLSPPLTSEVIDLQGPAYSERDVADQLSTILDKPLQVVTVPRREWLNTLVQSGLPAGYAAEITALSEAEEDGLLKPRGDRRRRCATPLDCTLQHLLAAVSGTNA